jgi:hypothetical protein
MASAGSIGRSMLSKMRGMVSILPGKDHRRREQTGPFGSAQCRPFTSFRMTIISETRETHHTTVRGRTPLARKQSGAPGVKETGGNADPALGADYCRSERYFLISVLVELSCFSDGSSLDSSSGMIRSASFLPSSTPHWSKESTSQMTPWVKTLCS